jgi:RNA polymerase sigma-70 factor (ECF subfamily)
MSGSLPADTSTEDLVERCRRGDDEAWREFVERYSRYVYAILVRGFRLAEFDAEDVFQEVFARTYVKLGALRDDAAVRPWLARMTRNLAVDLLRSKSRETPAEVIEPEDLDDSLELLDEAMDVHGALGQVSEDCRNILERFFLRDESYRGIGEALGIPSGTIASRISRCLKKMRDLLEGRSETE